MKRNVSLAVLLGIFALALSACSSDPDPTATPPPTATPNPAGEPTSVAIPTTTPDDGIVPILPEDAEIDRKAAVLLGIDLHRQLWDTRPSNNYKFGFQWNVGEFAYQRANVEVRVIKGEIDAVSWAPNAVKTDGTEPVGFDVPEMPSLDEYFSIDGLFKVIQEAIESDPDRVSLGFDSVFGFPTSVIIEFLPGRDQADVSFFAAQLVPVFGPPE